MNRNTIGLKQIAIGLAALTYAGGVIYGDVMFLSVVQVAFPAGILASLAYAGAITTAISALLLPVALHFWFAPGLQYWTGIGFWIADVVVLALNAMLAYALATHAADGALLNWQIVTPATPLLAVLGWGLMFLFDTSHQVRHAALELEADLAEIHVKRLKEAAKSDDVAGTLAEGARRAAAEMASKLTGVRVEPAQQIEQPLQIAKPIGSNGHAPKVIGRPTGQE